MDEGLKKLLDELNPKQRQAASMQEKSALIIAGAGSGKTKVLTSRVAYLIKEQKVSPTDILAVTFTNKAAKEMVERLELIGVSTKGMWVGTFHGICNRILRQFHKKTHLPSGFQILDTDDSKSLVRRIYKQNGWEDKGVDGEYPKAKDVYSFIMAQKESGVRVESYIPGRGSNLREEEFKCSVFEQYEEQLKKEGAVDFPELLLLTVELFEKDEQVRSWVQKTFRHVLIDEFQDTNALQYRWLKILTGQKNAVFAVGDDDQCFAAGTRVLMGSSEQKNIEDIQVGDRVMCSNGDALASAKVLRIHSSKKRTLKVHLHNGSTLVCTPEHIHLKVQMPTERQSGMRMEMVMNAQLSGHALRVVGFEPSRSGRLSALGFGLYSQGVEWVAERVSKSMEELEELCGNLIKEFGLNHFRQTKILGQHLKNTRTDGLKVGDMLLGLNANQLTITDISSGEECDVYDIDVEGYHNFVANGVFTHNSIYGFRGAQVKNMQHFLMDFNVHTESMIRLEQNYRSDGNILKAANALIEKNTDRLGKSLWTSSEDGAKITIDEQRSEVDEAAMIVKKVQRLQDRGVPLKDIAFLYRVNAQSRVLEQALMQKGIRYVIYGGLRFFERAEIKNAMGYLRLVANSRDDSALLRVVNMPARGVGAKTIERLMQNAKVNKSSLWEALVQQMDAEKSSGLKEFYKLIEQLRAQKEQGASLEQLVRTCIEKSALIAMYRADREDERIENLQELISAAKEFELESLEEERNIESFLAHCALQSAVEGETQDDNVVQMMTVHASKGLEFKHVFLVGLEEGIFPHVYSNNQEQSISQKDLEEERRLMYVAITRAKKELSISYVQQRNMFGRTVYNPVSRFLNELPNSIVTWNRQDNGSDRVDGEERLFNQHPRQGIVSIREQFDFSDQKNNSKGGRVQSIFQKNIEIGGFVRGDVVEHQKFGSGVVRQIVGSGEDATIEIDFEHAGRRCLVIKYAKLQKVQ